MAETVAVSRFSFLCHMLPSGCFWIPRQARYDNYRPPGLRHGVSRV